MHLPLIEILKELKSAKAKISRTETKKINLFESNQGIEVRFNNFKNPSDYLNHVSRMYFECKSHFDEIICNSTDPKQCCRELAFAKFEIKEFKNFYFPSDDRILFRRLDFDLNQEFPLEFEEALKKNSRLL